MSYRFFLYSYDSLDNFLKCKEKNLLGFPKGKDYSWSKVFHLQPGDIVLIRNSSTKTHLEFFGHCVVIENAYEEDGNILIWGNELLQNEVIYPIRVKVDFDSIDIKKLYTINWADLETLNWRNKKNRRLLDKKALAVKFSKGNFVEGVDAENLANLLNI